MKKDVFVIESPLQLVNAIEAIEYFKIDNYHVYVRLSEIKQNDEQLIRLQKIYNIEENKLSYITVPESSPFLKMFKIIIFWISFIFKFININKLYIGNFDSPFLKGIYILYNKKDVVLLDDGAKSIDIQNNFTLKNNYHMFSMYDIPVFKNQSIFKNKYAFLNNMLENNCTNVNSEIIVFVGAKLSEIGIVTEKYYLESLSIIFNNYTDKKIIYIPHRGEDDKKLKKIEEINNVQIKSLNYPIELYGLFEDHLPIEIISFYSSALLTMNMLYNNVTVKAFKFDYSNYKRADQLDDVYKYYINYVNVCVDLC